MIATSSQPRRRRKGIREVDKCVESRRKIPIVEILNAEIAHCYWRLDYVNPELLQAIRNKHLILQEFQYGKMLKTTTDKTQNQASKGGA